VALTKPIPLLGLNIIAGAIAEAGRMRKSATELALEGVWLQSYGVYIAANTFLGPVYFGYSDFEEGRGAFLSLRWDTLKKILNHGGHGGHGGPRRKKHWGWCAALDAPPFLRSAAGSKTDPSR
jgi:hypothetical protein